MNYIIYRNQKMPIFVVDNKLDTTILFLHGLNSSSNFINKMLDFKQNFNIVAVNLPGSKFAPAIDAEEITLESWIEFSQLVLNSIKTKKILILAHSMSGGVAVELAKDPRVEKAIMLSTINPSMENNKSYKLLNSVIGPEKGKPTFFGKLFIWGAKFSKKGKQLVNSFTREGKWYNLLEKYILKPEYLKKLDELYKKYANKLIFIVGDKDGIIGTDNFIKYGTDLGCMVAKIGSTHSPIKTAPEQINSFLNLIVNPKKRFWFFNKFITFSKNIMEVNNNLNDESDIASLEIYHELENNIEQDKEE